MRMVTKVILDVICLAAGHGGFVLQVVIAAFPHSETVWSWYILWACSFSKYLLFYGDMFGESFHCVVILF